MAKKIGTVRIVSNGGITSFGIIREGETWQNAANRVAPRITGGDYKAVALIDQARSFVEKTFATYRFQFGRYLPKQNATTLSEMFTAYVDYSN